MIIAFSGTPGTGKTAAASALGDKYNVISVIDIAREADCIQDYDSEAGSYNVDVEKLKVYVETFLAPQKDVFILDGHLSHLLSPDWAVIFRTKPSVLKVRLEERGYSPEKVWENVEAEAVDVIYVEALEALEKDRIFEMNTTNIRMENEVSKLKRLIEGLQSGRSASTLQKELGMKPGNIDWSDDFSSLL